MPHPMFDRLPRTHGVHRAVCPGTGQPLLVAVTAGGLLQEPVAAGDPATGTLLFDECHLDRRQIRDVVAHLATWLAGGDFCRDLSPVAGQKPPTADPA